MLKLMVPKLQRFCLKQNKTQTCKLTKANYSAQIYSGEKKKDSFILILDLDFLSCFDFICACFCAWVYYVYECSRHRSIRFPELEFQVCVS